MSNKLGAAAKAARSPKKQPLDRRIGLRLSHQELSVLESRALRRNQSLSDFLRSVALEPTAAEADYATRAWADGQEMLGRLEQLEEQLQTLQGMMAAVLYLQQRQVPSGVFNELRAGVQFAMSEDLIGDLLPELATDLLAARDRQRQSTDQAQLPPRAVSAKRP